MNAEYLRIKADMMDALPDLMKRPDGNPDPISDCRRLRLHNEAKQRRVAFWERLTACLRGFTQHSLRPVSFRWQARFKDWRSAYVEAEKQLTLARSC